MSTCNREHMLSKDKLDIGSFYKNEVDENNDS